MFREVGDDGRSLETAANAGKVRRQIGQFATKFLRRPVTTKALGRQAPISHVQSNAAVSTADLANCIGVTERTLLIYNTVSKETRRKVAVRQAGNVEPAKVHLVTDCKFEPNPYSLLPDEPTAAGPEHDSEYVYAHSVESGGAERESEYVSAQCVESDGAEHDAEYGSAPSADL